MTESATSRALAIPEIVALIVEHGARQPYVPDQWQPIWRSKSAMKYALIGRFWLQPVLNAVWENIDWSDSAYRYRPSEHHFSALSEVRQQYYANKVRGLHIERSFLEHMSTTKTAYNFPKLRRLDVYAEDPYDTISSSGTHFSALLLLPSTLEELSVWRPTMVELQTLSVNCPSLRRLEIHHQKGDLCDVVGALPSLETFRIHQRYPGSINSEDFCDWQSNSSLFTRLARCANLKQLQLPFPVPIDNGHAKQDTGGSDAPFASLMEFKAYVQLARVPRLIYAFNPDTLRKLSLSIQHHRLEDEPSQWSEDATMISHLTALCQLHQLDISIGGFLNSASLSSRELEALGCFNDLRVLSIGESEGAKDIVLPGLTDSVLMSISQFWPRLEEFRVSAKHAMTTQSVITLGQNCSRLKVLDMTGLLDASALEGHTEGLFPELQALRFDQACYGTQTAIETTAAWDVEARIMDILFACMPSCAPPCKRPGSEFCLEERRRTFGWEIYFENDRCLTERIRRYMDSGIDPGVMKRGDCKRRVFDRAPSPVVGKFE